MLLSWLSLVGMANAEPGEKESSLTNSDFEPCGALSLRWENDAFAGTDRDYSNGTSLSYMRRGRGWLGEFWDLFGEADREYFQSYELGQVIVTPADTSRAIPDPKDRPYAGLLYLSFSTAARHDNQLNGLKLVTGVVGPDSMAGDAQNWFHSLIGNGQAQGWHYQLHNEPILNLLYEHRRKYSLFQTEPGFAADCIPSGNIMLGNVLIQGHAAAEARLGWNLPDDFGTTLLRGFGTMPFAQHPADRPAARLGAYVFGGIGGTAVARNLTLDGNTFQDSPHVEKRSLFASGEVGASLWTRWCQAAFSYVMWGKEFYGQQSDSRFGAASLTVFF